MKIIGLDVGTKRIGVAYADTKTRIAIPSGVVMVNGQEFNELARIAKFHQTNIFVLGLPRNNQGQETAQSTYVRKFARQLTSTIPHAKIYFQDESLTSVEAEERLKTRKGRYQKGEIDTEAACIILQDCIERFSAKTTTPPSSSSDSLAALEDTLDDSILGPKLTPAANSKDSHMKTKSQKAKKSKKSLLLKIGIFLVLFLGVGSFLAYSWYHESLKAPVEGINCQTEVKNPSCQFQQFSVNPSESSAKIATNLKANNLIKDELAFRLSLQFSGLSAKLKVGVYQLRSTMPASEIIAQLVKGNSKANTFSFTILPGETISQIKQKLVDLGFSSTDLNDAFGKTYFDHPKLQAFPEIIEQLKNYPASCNPEVASQFDCLRPLEGLLYPDTYEFYKTAKPEEIIVHAIEHLFKAIKEKDLLAAFAAQNLNLPEALTLASIIQKEANSPDHAGVAQVFLLRHNMNIMLGSDVTASYAADLVDPERKTYTDQAAVLGIDSPFNTRKHAGIPPTPISTPSLSALSAVAHPAEGSYLYFLTGDDGKMYYGKTEEEHNQNRSNYCQKLCNHNL